MNQPIDQARSIIRRHEARAEEYTRRMAWRATKAGDLVAARYWRRVQAEIQAPRPAMHG